MLLNNLKYMNKIAVIKTGGKQYKVKENQLLKIEKLDKEIGDKVKFDTLLVSSENGENLNLGKPLIGQNVEAKIVEHGKSKKVNIAKYKNKIRQKKKVGHRQSFTKVEILSIIN